MYKITDAHTHEQKNAALYTFDLGQVKIHIYIYNIGVVVAFV